MHMKKAMSVLLALLLMVGVIAIMPITAGAAVRSVSTAAELATELAAAASGDTIKLLADITYTSQIYISNGKSITFDLNGKTLSAAGLFVENGDALLADPANGAFNVSRNADEGVTVEAVYGKAEVTNVIDSGNSSWALCAEGGEIIVYGDVAYTGTFGGTGTGAVAYANGKITINGAFTVTTGVQYIDVEGISKTKTQYEAKTSKAGYFEYKGTNENGTSTVWVKAPNASFVGLFGLNTKYMSTPMNWLKFIVLFGFIWMWF